MTREEAIEALKWFKEYKQLKEEDYRIQDKNGNWYYLITEQDFEAFNMAIEALEQEPILDKIRAEIDVARFIDKDTKLCKNANASGLEVALQIIDKYRAERGREMTREEDNKRIMPWYLEPFKQAIETLKQEPTTNNLCDSCGNSVNCMMQSGIVRKECGLYKPSIKNDLGVDCISRKAVLEITAETGALETQNRVKALPSVTPQEPRWISVSERLPEPNRAVLTYVSTGASETYCLAYWNDVRNGWEDWIGYELIETDREYKVLAWMPLPEPYKAESEENNGTNN